jgi:hypothetical protein
VEKPKADKATEPTESYEQRVLKIGGVAFSVWDVAGKASVRSLWSSYYKQGGIGPSFLPSPRCVSVCLVCLFGARALCRRSPCPAPVPTNRFGRCHCLRGGCG